MSILERKQKKTIFEKTASLLCSGSVGLYQHYTLMHDRVSCLLYLQPSFQVYKTTSTEKLQQIIPSSNFRTSSYHVWLLKKA